MRNHVSSLGRRNFPARLIALLAAQVAGASGHDRVKLGSGVASQAAALDPEPEVIVHRKKSAPAGSAPEPPAPKTHAKKPMVVQPAYEEKHEGRNKGTAASGGSSWWKGISVKGIGFMGYVLLFAVVCVALLLAALVRCCCCAERRRTARPLIAETPAKFVSEMREGEWAKVVGVVEYQLQEESGNQCCHRSPLCGRSCVYFSVSAEAIEKDGAHGGVVASRQKSCDFYIVDATGQRILVSSADLCAYHLRNVNHTAHVSEQLPVEARKFVRDARRKAATAMERSYIFEEALIEGGKEVVAVGVFAVHPHTGEPLLQSDTSAHQQLTRRKANGFDHGLKSLEPEEMHQLAAHVLVSDDPALF